MGCFEITHSTKLRKNWDNPNRASVLFLSLFLSLHRGWGVRSHDFQTNSEEKKWYEGRKIRGKLPKLSHNVDKERRNLKYCKNVPMFSLNPSK